jgi:predicted aspartyl protease
MVRSVAACVHGLVYVAVAAAAVQAQRPGDHPAVKITLAQDHWPLVSVWVGHDGPFEFLLDTGTNVTMLSPELADRIGLRPTARVTLETIDRRHIVPYARLAEVRIGPRTVKDIEVVLTDLSHLRVLGPRVSGILGHNALSRSTYTLDYRKEALSFPPIGEEPADGYRLTTRIDDGRVVVEGHATAGGRRLRLVLDSGVSRLLLRDRLLRSGELEAAADAGALATAISLSGSSALRATSLRRLAIGSLTLSNVPAALLRRRSDATVGDWDGLLPTSLFDWIFFNNAEGYIVVQTRDPNYRRTVRLHRGPGR